MAEDFDPETYPLGDPNPPAFPERWASDFGQDQDGLWMAFTFREVRYGFRWIPPGRFWMGSPENEKVCFVWAVMVCLSHCLET